MRAAHSLLVALVSLGTAATAQDAMPHEPLAAGPLVRQVCAACHGIDGNSTRPEIPSLAGQIAPYLDGQLHAFAAQGRQRANGVMGAMAVNLSADEMRRVSDYFAHQPLRPSSFIDAPRRDRADGEELFFAGIPKNDVPSCASCHGMRGEGLPDLFPRLAGQQARYTSEQLRHFRDGSRSSDPHAMMRKVAANLSDHDIDAVSIFVARLR